MEQWYSAAGDQQPLWCEHTGKLVPEAAAADAADEFTIRLIPLSNLSTRRLASFSAAINIGWRYSLALLRWAEVELERSAGSLTLVKVTSVSLAFL